MKNRILDLSKQFISFKSISGNKKALDEIFELALLNLSEFTIEKFSKNGVKSVLVYNTKKRPNKFKVLLTGHLDAIPGKDNQYKPKVVGKKLYGVGATDMKASAACLILSFSEVAAKVDYPIALQLITDEESGSMNGAWYQMKKGVRADFVIAGETTNFNIVNRAKGVVWMKISTQGKTAHSAYPWQGKNSILEMNGFLNMLQKKYPILKKEVWETTISVSHIETTNNSFNKIPDDCTVWLDVRYIPEEKNTIVKKIKSLVPKSFDLDIIFEEPPLLVNKNNKYVKMLQSIASKTLKHKVSFYSAHGTSDVTYFTRVGCSGVEFGPIGVRANNNEYVDIQSLEAYYEILTKFLLSFSDKGK